MNFPRSFFGAIGNNYPFVDVILGPTRPPPPGTGHTYGYSSSTLELKRAGVTVQGFVSPFVNGYYGFLQDLCCAPDPDEFRPIASQSTTPYSVSDEWTMDWKVIYADLTAGGFAEVHEIYAVGLATGLFTYDLAPSYGPSYNPLTKIYSYSFTWSNDTRINTAGRHFMGIALTSSPTTFITSALAQQHDDDSSWNARTGNLTFTNLSPGNYTISSYIVDGSGNYSYTYDSFDISLPVQGGDGGAFGGNPCSLPKWDPNFVLNHYICLPNQHGTAANNSKVNNVPFGFGPNGLNLRLRGTPNSGSY